MIRRPALAALLFLSTAVPSPALADERRIATGSFDRLRIAGTFEVTVTTGASPDARVVADRSVLGDIDVRVEGGTLIVRNTAGGSWTQPAQRDAGKPVRILLSTPALTAITVTGGSRVTVTQLKGARVDLSVAGSGAIAAADVSADQLTAQLIGDGGIAIARGRTGNARLTANGAGTIDVAGVEANDLTARLDGLGTISARARYSAQVASGGLGTIRIAGRPKCRVIAAAGAPVTCGD